MERKRRLFLLRPNRYNDRMSGIVTTRTASTDVIFGGEDVDELALPLVAPLGAEDDSHCTQKRSSSQYRCRTKGNVEEVDDGKSADVPLIVVNPPSDYSRLQYIQYLLTRPKDSNEVVLIGFPIESKSERERSAAADFLRCSTSRKGSQPS